MQLDPEETDRRARLHMATAAVDYLEAVRFVSWDAATQGQGEKLFLAAAADPESLRLHEKILKVIEEERARGNTLSYAEARRRVELVRLKR